MFTNNPSYCMLHVNQSRVFAVSLCHVSLTGLSITNTIQILPCIRYVYTEEYYVLKVSPKMTRSNKSLSSAVTSV